jgi:hypothetical protein
LQKLAKVSGLVFGGLAKVRKITRLAISEPNKKVSEFAISGLRNN